MASKSANRTSAFALPLLLAAGLMRWDPVMHRPVPLPPARRTPRAK
jgi:hypothetical protein